MDQTVTGPVLPWWVRLAVGRYPRRTFLRAALLLVGSLILFKGILLPIRVMGISMAPTYTDGTINFVNRLSYFWRVPQRGDVVGVRYAGRRVMLLKRLIGLPGERVAIVRGVVYINGKFLDELYVQLPRAPWETPEVQLGDNEYFIIGDNRSMDVHEKGTIDDYRIVGKVLF